MRVDASLQGLTVIQAYDGKSGWRVNPFEGRKDAERMGADEARALADEALIDGALLSASARVRRSNISAAKTSTAPMPTNCAYRRPTARSSPIILDPDVYLEIKILENRTIAGRGTGNRD